MDSPVFRARTSINKNSWGCQWPVQVLQEIHQAHLHGLGGGIKGGLVGDFHGFKVHQGLDHIGIFLVRQGFPGGNFQVVENLALDSYPVGPGSGVGNPHGHGISCLFQVCQGLGQPLNLELIMVNSEDIQGVTGIVVYGKGVPRRLDGVNM